MKLFLLLALFGLLAQPAVAAAADWTVQPAANSFGAGRQSYGYTIAPGAEVSDGVVVVNHGAAQLQLPLRPRGVGGWVHLDQPDVTVPPGETAQIPFSIAVPSDAKPGDRVGSLAGVPIRLRVGGPLTPRLAVGDVRVDYANPAFGKGDATVSYTLRNTGNAILGARQTVSIAGPFGIAKVAAGKLPDTRQLAPGAGVRVSAQLHGVTPAIRSTATVNVIPLLPDAAGSIAPLPAIQATGKAWTFPWTLLAAIALICALAAGLARRRRVPVPA